MAHHKLPVVDFTKKNSLKPGSSSWFATCNDVKNALEDYGCFIALYDEVSFELNEAVFCALEDFFELPTETKVQNKSNRPFFGYMGDLSVMPLYESLGIELANTHEGVQSFTNAIWPNRNLGFSETLLSYTKLAAEFEQIVVRMVCESYGIGKYYESHLRSATYLTRASKYRTPEKKESNTAFVSHTDRSFMTVLRQNQVNGLEVKTKYGQWLKVDFPPSSFIVIAGDAAMAWSNKRIHAPHHRVIINGKERYSIAQFSYMTEMVETPVELVDEEHPLQFKPFDHFEFLKFFSKEENMVLECPIQTYCGV